MLLLITSDKFRQEKVPLCVKDSAQSQAQNERGILRISALVKLPRIQLLAQCRHTYNQGARIGIGPDGGVAPHDSFFSYAEATSPGCLGECG